MALVYLRWALRAALAYPPSPHNPERPSWYPTEDDLNFQGIDAPTLISQIPKVEKQNNLAINVFGWDKGVTIHRLSKQPQEIPRINMLLIEKAGKFHYTWIKNLNRLLYASKHWERKYFCERCLYGFVREDMLESHRPGCRGIGQTALQVEMLEKGKNKLTFRNITSSCRPPTSSMQTLWLSPLRLRGLSWTPQRATLRGHNTMRLVVIATSWCGVMVRQSHQSNTAAPMQQSTSYNHCRKKRAKSRVC